MVMKRHAFSGSHRGPRRPRALAAGPSAIAVQAQSDVTGVWQITLNTQTGEQVWTATFEQNGGALSGEIDMNDSEGALPVEGTVEGAMIKLGLHRAGPRRRHADQSLG